MSNQGYTWYPNQITQNGQTPPYGYPNQTPTYQYSSTPYTTYATPGQSGTTIGTQLENELQAELEEERAQRQFLENELANMRTEKDSFVQENADLEQALGEWETTHSATLNAALKVKHDTNQLMICIFNWCDRNPHLRSELANLAKTDLTCETRNAVIDHLNRYSFYNLLYKYCADSTCPACTQHRLSRVRCAAPTPIRTPIPESRLAAPPTWNITSAPDAHPTVQHTRTISQESIADEGDDGDDTETETLYSSHASSTPCRKNTSTPASIDRKARDTSVTPGRRQANPQPPGKLHRKSVKAGKARQNVRIAMDKFRSRNQ